MVARRQTIFVAILFLGLLGLGGWFCVWFIGVLLASDKAVQVSVIAAAVSVFGVLFAFWKERSRSIREAHRDKKIEVYSHFYGIVFDLLRNGKDGIKIDLDNDKTFRDRWFELNKGAIFYGSPDVINALSRFKYTGTSPSPGAVLMKIGDIFLAMRKDIGLSNWGLDNIGIHQIYINDDVRALVEVEAKK